MAQLRLSIENRCEGLMVKALDPCGEVSATYQPAVRSNAWLKLRKDYVSGMADTLDVVPIGGWWGNGSKAGWFSPILLAVYDADAEEWQSLSRCMSGFTDAFYTELNAFFSDAENQLTREAARRVYTTGEQPSVWFKPLRVWEVKGADLTLSPVHAAARGLVHESRGVGLRFPRFIRSRSHEKRPEDATTARDVAALYLKQRGRPSGTTMRTGILQQEGAGADDSSEHESEDAT